MMTKMSINLNPNKEELMKTVFKTHAPNFASFVEAQLGDQDFLCGSQLTAADFWVGALYLQQYCQTAASPLSYGVD